MNMLSFYGGPAGKDFTIAKIFPNKTAMDADIALGNDSPIYAGDYVLISYGDPNQPEFVENLTADGDISYNATLWKKEWNNGYSYKEIMSIASNYPKFTAGNIDTSLKFGEAPQLTIDSSSLASPKVGLKMPASLRAGTANTTEPVAPTATASITPVYGGTLGNELSFQAKIPQGVTFTPSVSDEGEISWTNNGKLDNPVTVNIKGPKGDIGEPGPAGVVDISLNITGATVGQIAKITAVDGSGKPTAWEAGDLPNNEKFIVTFSGNYSSYACDKTMDEIVNAYENGQDISAYFTGTSESGNVYTNLLLSLATYDPGTYIEFKSDIEIYKLFRIVAFIDGTESGGVSEYTALDDSLTENHMAADAKAVGDALARKQGTLIQSGATVGQIAKITSVDDTGKPTAWEAVDMPSGGGGGHWETVLDTVWAQDVINPTAYDAATGIFTCASGELDNLALDTEYLFFQQCVKEGVAYNTIIPNNGHVKITKLSDTTFSIDVTPPTTFVPTNVKFSKGACLAITDIDAKKIRLTLDGQFGATASKYNTPFFGASKPYFAENVGYVSIQNAYHAYQQVTAEVESPYRIVGEILCGFNAPSATGNFHFKNNSFCCPLIPYNVPEGNARTYFLTSDGTKIAKLYSTAVPWFLGGGSENTAIINDYLSIISGTKVKLERWVE